MSIDGFALVDRKEAPFNIRAAPVDPITHQPCRPLRREGNPPGPEGVSLAAADQNTKGSVFTGFEVIIFESPQF
jgi:hypothetical protein